MARNTIAALAFLLSASPLFAQNVHVQVAPVPAGVAVPAIGAAPIARNQAMQLSYSGISAVPALPMSHAGPVLSQVSPHVLPKTQAPSVGAALPSARTMLRQAVSLRGKLNGARLVPKGGKGVGAALDQVRRSVPKSRAQSVAATAETEQQETAVETDPDFSRLSSLFDGGVRKTEVQEALPASRPAYLAETDGKSGTELVEAVHRAARRDHHSVGYEEARAAMFAYVDNVVQKGVRGVKSLYSRIFVAGKSSNGNKYRERGDVNGDGFTDSQGMNAEHLWPQSYFKQRAPMRSDLHHIFPAFQHPNSVRSRFPFGEVPDDAVEYRTRSGAKLGDRMFEPPDAAKGRIARAMLYFYTRYLGFKILPRNAVNYFWNSKIEMFLRWNRMFPPTAEEIRRNDLVEEVQGNRNPFVDDPGLADRIGAEGFQMEGRRSRSYASSGYEPQAPQHAKHKKHRKHKKHGHRKKKRKHR